MIYSIEEAIDLIQDILDDKPRLGEWHDLVSLPSEDEFTSELADRLAGIKFSHGGEGEQFLSKSGEADLAVLLNELEVLLSGA